MKFPSSKTSGSTLMVAIMVTGVISAVMGSYLYLLQSQNRSVMQSMAWNAALPMAEAGIEEAMTHMTRNTFTNLSRDGWSLSGSNYTKRGELADGHYRVYIPNSTNLVGSTGIKLRSTGYVRRPSDPNTYVARSVEVGINYRPQFMGLVVRQTLTLGGNFYADSFDSSDTNKSTGGLYDPLKKDDNTFIGTLLTNSTSRVSGNVEVRGKMATGPGGGITSSGSSYVIGDFSQSTGTQSGALTSDLNMDMPSVSLPFLTGYPASSGTVNGTNYTAVLDGGNFSIGSLSVGSTLYVSRPSVLYVSGNASIRRVVIAAGATLELYVGGASATFEGTAIANAGGLARNFRYFGLPTNTSINFNGDAYVIGTIYAPQAAVSAGSTAQLFGGLAALSFTGNGNFDFHYDESLGKGASSSGFQITFWDEVAPPPNALGGG